MDFRDAITSIQEKIRQLQHARVCLIEAEASEGRRQLLEQDLAPVNAGGPARKSEQMRAKRAASQQRRRAREREAVAPLGSASDVAPAESHPERINSPAQKTGSVSPLHGALPIQPVVVSPHTLNAARTRNDLILARKDSAPAGDGSLDALPS